MGIHTSNGAPQPQALSSKVHSLKTFKDSQGRVVREIVNKISKLRFEAALLVYVSKQEHFITHLLMRCFTA
jgi:hypothetical protein